MQNIFRNSSIFVCILLIAGCTSKPRKVNASVPLVTFSQEKPNKEVVPERYWQALSDPSQLVLPHTEFSLQLSELYTSALGKTCRELTITDKTQVMKRRIVCEISFLNAENEQQTAWFLENEIIESTRHFEL
ncbi:hypothetical protein ACLKMH_09310 [Psychromonas sp. KJ10-10]|uniref:hypothetical protein n=1 Tax=Psychromonas sp. KJ10-10 TaxID=3391823 RepID=UPI0039B38013